MKEKPQSLDSDEVLKFASDSAKNQPVLPTEVWKILIADDDKEVHVITRLVLEGGRFRNKAFQILDAYNYQGTLDIIKENPDIVVLFLDVVMDEDDTGLKIVKYIRDELHNHSMRIVIRTGQPGYAPEDDVIMKYDINDYRLKTELSAQKLKTSVVSSIRSFNDIATIQKYNSELLYLNNLKNTFISRFSKDLNPTLKNLSQQLDKLELELGADHVHVKEIMKHFNRLDVVINKELSVISLENEVQKLFSDKIDFNILIKDILERHKEEIEQKKLDISVEISSVFSQYNGNIHLFELLIDELLCNALYYNKLKGKISIKGKKENNYLVLSISDTGQGIPEGEIEDIFQAFYRGKDSEQMYRNGAGLGLFMVNKILSYYKGFVRVKSTGQGSQFDISFLINT